MNSKFIFCIALGLLLAQTVFATQARIESMGKRPAFFLDDMSIFENPANATFYSNALMGELGFYNQNSLRANDVGKNKDPFTPWFGGLFKYGLSDKGLKDPQITIGGLFGREHYEFTRYVPKKIVSASGDTVPIPQTITNFDAFLAGTMIDGSAIGAHVYVGVQDGKQDDGLMGSNAHASILSMDYGANFLVSAESSIEITLGVARIQYGPSHKTFLDPGLFSFYSSGRFFLEMDAWSGQFITGYKIAGMEVPDWTENFYNLNFGVNVIIPRGLVWFGIDAVNVKEEIGTWYKVADSDSRNGSSFIYREPGSLEEYNRDTRDQIGGVLSFGIERNVWKNWLIMRAGGQKSFIYNTCENLSGKTEEAPVCELRNGGTGKGNYWSTNPHGDGSLDDHIGFGVGFNIDNKLKIDANVAEDIFLRNPFRGEGRLISRISAIYTF
jgi:hypothetical protein